MGVDLSFIYIYIYIYIYTHIWVWLGWYFVWIFLEMSNGESSHNWFFLFFSIWADGYTYLKNSFHIAEGGNALFFWQFQIQALDLLDFGKLLFWPCCVLSHNNSIQQEGKQKTKKKLALACLTYETPWSGLIGWGWVPHMSMPVIFIISKYIKNYILFRW